MAWRCKTLYLSGDLYLCGDDFLGSGSLGDCWNKGRNTAEEEGNCAGVLNDDGDENDDVCKRSEGVIILRLLDVRELILAY